MSQIGEKAKAKKTQDGNVPEQKEIAETQGTPDEEYAMHEDDTIEEQHYIEEGSALVKTDHGELQKLSKEGYMQRLNELAELVEFERKIILKVNKTYNCWVKYGDNYEIASPGVNQLLPRLGVCYTEPKVVHEKNEDGKFLAAIVTCEMWKPNDPYVKAYPRGRVSAREPFYAKKDTQTQIGKIENHARTRMFKEGLKKLYPVQPTVEELEDVGVDVGKIQGVSFG